jgi:hypothetical protein
MAAGETAGALTRRIGLVAHRHGIGNKGEQQ